MVARVLFQRLLKDEEALMAYGVGTDYGKGELMDPPENQEKPEREYDENLTDRFDGVADDFHSDTLDEVNAQDGIEKATDIVKEAVNV
jgi:hypothetical protein